jgi:hypothetical protein
MRSAAAVSFPAGDHGSDERGDRDPGQAGDREAPAEPAEGVVDLGE